MVSVRSNQNYRKFLFLKKDHHLWNWTDEQLIDNLSAFTLGRVKPSSTTKIKRIEL